MFNTSFIMKLRALKTSFIMFQKIFYGLLLFNSFLFLTFVLGFKYELFNVFNVLYMSGIIDINKENKEIIQSYILTAAKYDFSVYEKRILYRIIELMSEYTKGKKLNCQYHIQESLFGDVDIQMPTSAFLKDEKDQNYSIVKKALMDLNLKRVQFVDEERKKWYLFNIIERPVAHMKQGFVSFRIHPIMAAAFMDFSMGHRKFELKTSMQFESIYAMRFYELMSGQSAPITFGIDKLKEMFKLEEKYKRVNDFFKYVIYPAKRELDKYSPFSFEYKINKDGKKYKSITFYPVKISKNIDDDVRFNHVVKELSIQYAIPKNVVDYMMNNFGVTEKEMKQHYKLLKEANKSLDLLGLLSEKKRYIADARSPMGYIVSMLRERINVEEDEEPIEVPEDGTYREPTEQERREAAAAIAELSARTGIDFSRKI